MKYPRLWRRRRSSQATTAAVPLPETHLTLAQTPLRLGVDAQVPDRMPRGEDDEITRAGSREFHDRPGGGRDTTKREFFF